MDNQKEINEENGANEISEKDLGKIGNSVVAGYKKIEDAAVSGYKKIEDAAVSGYKKTEDFFVEHLFTKKGETVEQAKNRLKQQNPNYKK